MHDWVKHSSWSALENDNRESLYTRRSKNEEANTFINDLVASSNTFRFESPEELPVGHISQTQDNQYHSVIEGANTVNGILDKVFDVKSVIFGNNNNNNNHLSFNDGKEFGNGKTSDAKQGPELFDGLELDVVSKSDDIEGGHSNVINAQISMSPPATRLMPPLNELGPAAADHLTPQQQSILLELYDNLSAGIIVRKHGLTGKPRQRKLFVDSKLSRLLWRSLGTNPESDFRVSLGFTKGDADRELYINEIREVTDDLSTDFMQRSLTKHYITEVSNARGVIAPGVISIVLADRTVDFEVGMDNWELIYHALKILVNFYQNVLPNYHGRG